MFQIKFSKNQLKAICQEIKVATLQSTLTNIYHLQHQKYIFEFEKKGNLIFILFATSPFTSLHLIENFNSQAEILPLKTTLKGYKLNSVEILSDDKIIAFKLTNTQQTYTLIFEVFDKNPNFYLIDEELRILFSHFKIAKQNYFAPVQKISKIEAAQEPLTSAEIEKRYRLLEKELIVTKLRNEQSRIFNQQLTKYDNELIKLNKQLQTGNDWPKMAHLGDLIKANLSQIDLSQTEMTVWDWQDEINKKIQLKFSQNFQLEMQAYYKKAAKLKNSLEPTQEQIEVIRTKREKLLTEIKAFNELTDLQLLKKATSKSSSITKKKPIRVEKKPYKTFVSPADQTILVGKSAKDNDLLTFKIANGNDIWIHVADYAGSHVVIPVKKNQPVEDATIVAAMNLAIHFSKAPKSGRSLVTISQKKYVQRAKGGPPGKVQLSHHHQRTVDFDEKLIKQIFKHKQINNNY